MVTRLLWLLKGIQPRRNRNTRRILTRVNTRTIRLVNRLQRLTTRLLRAHLTLTRRTQKRQAQVQLNLDIRHPHGLIRISTSTLHLKYRALHINIPHRSMHQLGVPTLCLLRTATRGYKTNRLFLKTGHIRHNGLLIQGPGLSHTLLIQLLDHLATRTTTPRI